MEPMDHYIRLLTRKDDNGLGRALIASILFHVLLFAILTTTSIFYPTTGNAEKLDILWVYSSSLPGEPTGAPDESAPQEEPSVNEDKPVVAKSAGQNPPVQEEETEETSTNDPSNDISRKQEPVVQQLLPLPVTRKEAALTAERKSIAAERAERELLAAKKSAWEKAEQLRLFREKAESKRLAALSAMQERLARDKNERERIAVERAERELITTEKAAREKFEQERLSEEKAERERLAALTAAQERLAQERAERELLAVQKSAREKAKQERLSGEKAEGERLAALTAAQERLAHERAKIERTATMKIAAKPPVTGNKINPQPLSAAGRENKIAPAEWKYQHTALATKPEPQLLSTPKTDETAKQKTAGTSAEAKGIVSLALHGDLKLEISGQEDVKLRVVFREYPKARRNKAMTKAEAKREQNVIPVIARSGKNTKDAVIETAGAGIYVFIVEPAGDISGSSAFTLKLYETSSKAKTKSLGKKTVAAKTVIVKVLMPDGILWDDDSAFTGTLEDSDSTTKFNAQTGLYWKEYND
jgi:hypothetical protein